MSFHRRLRLSLVISALLGSLCWGAPLLAQQNLNEQFLSAVETGEWQQAIDLIDQIIAADPNREESLIPFREKYTQRLAIDEQLRQGNWRQSSALMEQFVTTYPEDSQSLNTYRSQLSELAQLQTTVEQGNVISALSQTRELQQSSPQLSTLMTQYEQQILAGIPGVGQAVTTPNYVLTVSASQDVTRQVDPEGEARQFLVRMTVQNTGAEALSLTVQGFGLFNPTTNVEASNPRDASSVLPEANIEPLGASLDPGSGSRTGIVFQLDSAPDTLFLSFGGGRLVRLR